MSRTVMDEAVLCLSVSADDVVMIISHNTQDSIRINKTDDVYDLIIDHRIMKQIIMLVILLNVIVMVE